MLVLVVNCPTRQSLLLFIGSLHWLSSWRWWPSMWGGKIVSATLEARNGRFDPFFFANLTNYISPDGEFCFCHLVFGVFRPQIHVFWGPITNFRKWGLLIVTLIFGNSWKPRKMDLFCGLKSVFGWYFFVFQPGIYIGRWDLQKNALDLVNLGP